MLLQTVEIDVFRNFTNKQSMAVDRAVTCLIGKNESGKTTVLKALHRLNPANVPDRFDLTKDYPRRHLARDRRAKDLEEVEPVTAVFSLEEADLDVLEDQLGVRPPVQTLVVASRSYGGNCGSGSPAPWSTCWSW
ncbi:AAA family ATPase [Streptomyces sp. NPDC001982]|uniref:AAA family ATPase n=1 Tax=Streptomyces sp. NPDC001982 TaxID=3154405 RepID=UPI003319E790